MLNRQKSGGIPPFDQVAPDFQSLENERVTNLGFPAEWIFEMYPANAGG